MLLYVYKQTFYKLYAYITREFLEIRMRNFQGIIFVWTRAYKEIFKSALLYLQIYFLLFSIFHVLRFFEVLQMFFFKLLLTLSWRRLLSYRNQTGFYMIMTSIMKELKWGKNEEKYRVQHILWSSKLLFCFWIDAYIFFQMVIFATLFRRCPTLWKSTLKMTTLFRCCPTLFSSTLKTQRCFNVVLRCKFQRWQTQRCFNVDLTLCDVATSYQPKNNVEPTLKCLLGCLPK